MDEFDCESPENADEVPDRTESDVHCIECQDEYFLTDGKCIEYTAPPSSNATFSPTTPSAEPTRAPTTEYGVRFTITYQYAPKYDSTGERIETNVTEAVTSSTEDFLNDSAAEVNESCVTSSDFAVSIDETSQGGMVSIHGTVYACDNETLWKLIDVMLENATEHLKSETLMIVGIVNITAEPINELEAPTHSPTGAPTFAPTTDWGDLIKEELDKEENAFIYMMGGLGSIICCCMIIFCFLSIMNAKKDWKRNAEEDAVQSKSRSNSDNGVMKGYAIKNTVTKEQAKDTAENIVPVYVDEEVDEQDGRKEKMEETLEMNQSSASTIAVPLPGMVKVESKEDTVNDEFEVIGDDMMTPGQIEETPGDIQNDDAES